MTQTVNAPISASYNNTIINFISKHIAKVNERLSGKESIGETSGQDTLNKWLRRRPFVKVLEQSVVPAGTLYVRDRLIIRFQLTNELASQFVLLRGLFEFAKPEGVLILSDRTDKTFVIETGVDQTEAAISYLEKTFAWVSKEVSFKTTLRKVIRWEEKVHQEREELFGKLHTEAA